MAKIETLQAVFVRGLNVDEQTIEWDNLEYRGIPEWDSVAHMALIAEIEDEYDIMLEVDDVIAMSSFRVACDILRKYNIDLSN